jgi:trk system potassium uptake protein TrkA
MNITVIGAGQVGYHVADVLSREGHRVDVVDSDPRRAQKLQESLDVRVVIGDAVDVGVLTRAEVGQSDLVVAVTDDDRTNMLCSALCRQLGVPRILVRLRDRESLEEYRETYRQALGWSQVLSVEDFAADEIVNAVRGKLALEVESFAGGRIQTRRYRVKDFPRFAGRSLSELDLPGGVRIAAVLGHGEFEIPSGERVLDPAEQIWAIGKRSQLDAFEVAGGAPSDQRRSVIVMGAGRIARSVIRGLLEVPGIHVRVIERDRSRAQACAAEFGGQVLVMEGDATDQAVLHEERIEGVDDFIATSGNDEQNLVACLLAQGLAVKRTIAIISKPSYTQVFDLVGVDHAIAPRILCANRILRLVRSGHVRAIAVLAEGKAEVLEVEVSFQGKRRSRKIKDLDLPAGVLVGALLRKGEALVPVGDTVVEDGNEVIVFSRPERVDRVLEVFGASREG